MQTIVHIGMPKTGSTALQSSLAASAAYLARKGLLYPENPPGDTATNHRLLAALFLGVGDLPRHMKGRVGDTQGAVDARLAEFLGHLRRQIATARPQGLILSYEGLFQVLPEARQATLRETYRGLGDGLGAGLGAGPGDELRFIAYLRKPSEHYLSGLQQRIKASTALRPPRPRGYRAVLESYAAAFGEGAVTARLFDRAHLENGDIVADFCTHALRAFAVDPARLAPGERSNETLSAESMDLVWRYRQGFHARRNNVFTRDTNQLRRALAAADRRHDAARPRLQPGLAEAIDYAAGDALWVRDRFGVVFPGLDYDRLAAGPDPAGAAVLAAAAAAASGPAAAIDALVVVDREVQARILDTLAQSRWAADDPGRRDWLCALRAPGGLARPRPGPAGAKPGKQPGKRAAERRKQRRLAARRA